MDVPHDVKGSVGAGSDRLIVQFDHEIRETTILALKLAITRRRPAPGLIFHSDRGSQNADCLFRMQCAHHRILRSISGKGDCWDNTVADSFFKPLKVEAVFGIVLPEENFAQRVPFEWFEALYNRRRRLSKLNQLTIPEFKNINLNLRWVASAYPPPYGFGMEVHFSGYYHKETSTACLE